MITTFVNRETELAALEQEYAMPGFSFYPIYGRRRIGKTELVLQFIKDKKSIYFSATSGTKKENVEAFKKAAENVVDLSTIRNDWGAILEHIGKTVTEKTVLVIDEFPYLVESEKGLSSIFQKAIDLFLKKSNVFLLLTGSSLAMMYKEVLDYRAPLYGRRTGQLELKELGFREAERFFERSPKEAMSIYGVCGGIPLYLNQFRAKGEFYRLLRDRVLKPDAMLREEPIFLLRQEFREPKVYLAILSAIALGNSKLGEIINYCGFTNKTGITPYLRQLESLGYVERETPALSSERAQGIYKIRDNFLKFWFRFVRPSSSLIDEDPDEAINLIKKGFDTYLGTVFEDVCRQYIYKILPFKAQETGRWWHKGEEIDILSVNKNTQEIAFFECKWGSVNRKEAMDILHNLDKKTESVKWAEGKRTEYHGLFARVIAEEDKKELRKNGYLVFDLDDLQQVK